MADEPTRVPDIPEASDVTDAEGGPRVSQRRSLSGATAIMASGTLVSRLLGFVRTALLSWAILAIGFSADAFDVANRIPNALYAVLAAGVFNSVLVPQIVKAFRRKDGKRTVDRIVTLGLVFSLAISVIFTIAAPFMVRLYASSDWSDDQRDLATAFAFLVIPQLFFYAAYTILGEVLNAREQFGPYMWAPALNNVIGIAGLLVYLAMYGAWTKGADNAAGWTPDRIAWLAIPATIAMAAQAGILIWPLLRGGYRPKFVWRGPKGELATVKVIAAWALAAVIVEQIGLAFAVKVASSANPGGHNHAIAGNAAYFYALLIYLLPHSLVTVSLLTALNTSMAKKFSAGDIEGVRNDVAKGLRITATFTSFATVALIVLAPWLVRLVLPKVPPVQVDAVAPVLVALALGMVPLGAMVLVKRTYFVLEDARGIFFIHIPMTIAWVAVAYAGKALFDPRWWTVGVALGLSVSNVVGLTLRAGGLRKRLGGLGGREVSRVHVLSALAAIVAALAGFALRFWVLPPPVDGTTNIVSTYLVGGFVCAVTGIVMAIVYVLILKATGVSDVNTMIARVTGRLRRNVR